MKINRYLNTFKDLAHAGKKAFVPFTVLGDPNPKKSLAIIDAFIAGGADILELGFPFSDPIADGPTIQAADTRALKAGVTTDTCFKLIAKVRKKHPHIPIGLLLYYNLVYAYGIDTFYKRAAQAGVDSILIADLPIEESKPVLRAAHTHNIHQVFIVSELTQPDRLKKILKAASGFLYVVNYVGTTGRNTGETSTSSKKFSSGLKKLITHLRKTTKLPLLLGFGISTRADIKKAHTLDIDGMIIGSALVKIVQHPSLIIKKTVAQLRQ